MDKTQKIIASICFATVCVIAGFTIYKWACFDIIDGWAILFGSLAIVYFFNTLTWGHHQGPEKNDELDEHIMAQSSKIGYYVLMTLSTLILFISEGFDSEINNYPLITVVALSFITLPVVEYIYSRKYK